MPSKDAVLFCSAVITPLILAVLCGYFFALVPLYVITAIALTLIFFCFLGIKVEGGIQFLLIALYIGVLLILMWGTALAVRGEEVSGLVDWNKAGESISYYWKKLLRK